MDIKRFYLEASVLILVIFNVRALDVGDIFEDDFEDSGSSGRCPWIRNKLKNGRVKIRSRGRIAKFLCEPGYELAGKRFATCVRGQWNNPLPVCVSRGCHRPPHVDNARVTLMYRGAVLTYDCLPGYTLEGVSSIYCDGRRWSADPPHCVVATTDPQTSCDFEDPDLCGWSHDPTHEFDWKRNQFATPSGHAGTGPSFDHTFGEGKGGYYIYMEASSPRTLNDTARLFSPVYPSDDSGGCFIFWYHMFGSTTGGLRVYVKPESHVFGELPPAWALYGDQGNEWFRGNISVPNFNENFQIIIEGVRGSSYIGDTAIDDVSINHGDCESIGNSTNDASAIFSDSCRGRCRESVNSSECGCNDDCLASHSCCDDFESICTRNIEMETDEAKKEVTSFYTTVGSTHGSLETEDKKPSSPFVHDTMTPKYATETTFFAEQNNKNTTLQSVITSMTKTTERTTFPSTSSLLSTSTVPTVKTAITSTPMTTSTTTTTTTPATTTTTPTTTTTTPTTTTTAPTTTTTTTTPATTTTSTTTPATTTTTTIPSTTTATTTSAKTPTIVTTTAIATRTATTSATTATPITISTKPLTTVLQITSTKATSQYLSTGLPPTRMIPFLKKRTTAVLPTTTTVRYTEASPTRIYNLRPRNRTTTSIPTQTTSNLYKPTTLTLASPTNLTNSSPLPQPNTSTLKFTTQIVTTKDPPAKTKIFTFPKEKSTEKAIIVSEAHASKTESVSNAGAPVITVVSVIIVLLICIIIGTLYFVRRWRAQKHSKFNDDSEMKFLSENEVAEYSDSSALDKINFNPSI